nr:MAG TPA: hypothetical protein [Caudoviricetes sp.]
MTALDKFKNICYDIKLRFYFTLLVDLGIIIPHIWELVNIFVVYYCTIFLSYFVKYSYTERSMSMYESIFFTS